MNQDKIGKLIAKLRKEKGLTQSDLGNKLGIGFKSVSKWERGQTCPDISIINELAKILGITTDELLNGELDEEHKELHNKPNKLNKKLLLLIIPVIVIIIIVFIFGNKYNIKQEIYILNSISKEYAIEGKMIFENNNISIYINKVKFTDRTLNEITIKNYQYELLSNEKVITRYGFLPMIEELDSEITIKEFTDTFNINYNNTLEIDHNQIIKNKLSLKFIFLDLNGNQIEKDIDISITKKA